MIGTTVALVMALQRLNNQNLAALNLMIHGWGKATHGTVAYRVALKNDLIRADGRPIDAELCAALAFEVNRRAEAGTFT